MEPLDGDLVHFVGDGVIPVSSQAADAGPDQEMRSDLMYCAEAFVDVASRDQLYGYIAPAKRPKHQRSRVSSSVSLRDAVTCQHPDETERRPLLLMARCGPNSYTRQA